MFMWENRLGVAETDEEVLYVARDFLASLDYFEIARLPHVCRPRKVRSVSDLTAYLLDLEVHQYAPDVSAESARVVLRLAMFFSLASSRLARIHNRAKDDDGSIKESA